MRVFIMVLNKVNPKRINVELLKEIDKGKASHVRSRIKSDYEKHEEDCPSRDEFGLCRSLPSNIDTTYTNCGFDWCPRVYWRIVEAIK